jgi:hypothetical protein
MLCYSIFLRGTQAQSSSQISISSQGSINYPPLPSPSPSPSPPSTNLAPMPDAWDLNGYYPGAGTPPQTTPYVFLDSSVLHNGNPSIRLDPMGGTDRATWGGWCNVKAGDMVVAKCWMKVASCSNPAGHGARFGIDFYDDQGYIAGTSADANGNLPQFPQPWTGSLANFVTWGSDWQQRTISFTVPSSISVNENGDPVSPPRSPKYILMWIQAMNHDDPASAWFADAELYINP